MLSSRFTKSLIVKSSKKLFCQYSSGCPAFPIQLVRNKAPEFKGKAWWNGEFKTINNDTFKGKWICLFFYPLDFTFVCPTEIVDYNNKAEEFAKLNCQLIGCSTDSHFSHREWALKPRDQGGLAPLSIPLLSDISKAISMKYGVLISNKEDDMFGVPLRGTFIIDDKQILRHMTVNDAPVGRNVEETLRLLKALQFADKHGEVCPSNWTPGKATIDPSNQKKLGDYWQKEHASKH